MRSSLSRFLVPAAVLLALGAASTPAHAGPATTPAVPLPLVKAAINVLGSQDTPFGQKLFPIDRYSTARYETAGLYATDSQAYNSNIVRYEWNRTYDPVNDTYFESDTGTTPVVRSLPLTIGKDVTAQVRVTNDFGQQDIASVTFRPVYRPQAVGTGPTAVAVGQPYVLDASKSQAWVDNGGAGEIESYDWDLNVDGTFDVHTGFRQPYITQTATTTGYHCVIVRVTDQNGTQDQTGICPKAYNAPSPVFTASPAAPQPGQSVTLDASGSTADSDIVSYEWDLDGNGSFEKSTGKTPTVTTTLPSGHTEVRLRVTDRWGLAATYTKAFDIGTAPAGGAAGAGRVAQPGTLVPLAIGLSPSPAKGKAGTASTRVSCPPSATKGCTGTVALTLKRALIGSARFRLAPGKSRTVRIALGAAARRALAKRPNIKLQANVHATDGGGTTGTTTTTIRVAR
jgi:hypothetical protein